jgi:hypothetical protein
LYVLRRIFRFVQFSNVKGKYFQPTEPLEREGGNILSCLIENISTDNFDNFSYNTYNFILPRYAFFVNFMANNFSEAKTKDGSE